MLDVGLVAQSLVNGLMVGGIYILVALGLTLVLSIMGIVQLAHGEVYMLGAYGTYFFCISIGVDFFLALVMSALIVGVLGIFLERFFFRPLRGQLLRTVIVTLALILVLQTAVMAGFGGSSKSIPSPLRGVLTILGVTISWERLIVILISIIMVLALLVMIQRTKIGQAMVAVSQDRDTAALQGININRISSIGMFLGCILAAVAGALVGAIFSVTPFMGSFALMKGITVIVLGGLGSIAGAIIGALILGLIDGLIPPLLSTHMAGIIGFAIIIIILLLRPQGIFGHE